MPWKRLWNWNDYAGISLQSSILSLLRERNRVNNVSIQPHVPQYSWRNVHQLPPARHSLIQDKRTPLTHEHAPWKPSRRDASAGLLDAVVEASTLWHGDMSAIRAAAGGRAGVRVGGRALRSIQIGPSSQPPNLVARPFACRFAALDFGRSLDPDSNPVIRICQQTVMYGHGIRKLAYLMGGYLWIYRGRPDFL